MMPLRKTILEGCLLAGLLSPLVAAAQAPLPAVPGFPENRGIALPRPRPAVAPQGADRQLSRQTFSGGSGGGSFPYLSIKTFGAIGDGKSHRLSTKYSTIAAAQAIYPFVSDLTQEIDWAATQEAIDYAFANGVQNTFCPAVTAQNASYQLSNPIEVNQDINFRGNEAWSSSTTYGRGAQVTYNGLPWQSLGSGNVGDPPTSASGYPANLSIAGNPLPYANVTITPASPAVVTLHGHGFSAGQPIIFLKQTYTDATYGLPAMPTGISADTVYYVLSAGLTRNSFEISTTPGGSAVNTSDPGSGVITVSTQVWQINITTGPDFSDRSNFIGDDGQSSAEGCRYTALSVTSPAFIIGSNNGNYIKSVTVTENDRANIYRCQAPTGLIGFGNISGGGGTHITAFDKVGASGFYKGFESTVGGNGQLGDSNTFINDHFTNGCFGIHIGSQENFINSSYDSTLDGNNIAASATLGTGLRIVGGNDSTPRGIATSFAITGVAAKGGVTMQATVSSPDGALLHPLCGYNLQCGYNAFNVVTQHFGVVPLTLDGFNPATGVVNLHVNSDWLGPYRNTLSSAMFADLEAVTKLYAAEAVTVYQGSGITVTGTHIENASSNTIPTTLVNSFTSFGSAGATHLSDVLLDYTASGDQFICTQSGCNGNPGDEKLAAFYAQQNLPFIRSTGEGSVIIDNLYGGFNVGGFDRVLMENGDYLEFRHTVPSQPTQTNPPFPSEGPGMLWNQRNGTDATFSGGYGGISGSGGFGGGKFENGSPWISGASVTGDLWRSLQWGASDFYGVKPAPYATPCITPAQVTALGSPAITFFAQISGLSLNKAGDGYSAGDTITLVGGTHSTAATIHVGSINGGGAITSFSISNNGNYSVETTSFTSTGGKGIGATWNNVNWWVNYTANYPLLWGGTQYNVCDYKGGLQNHYGLESTNLGYSYFTNLTTSNVPNLSWSSFGNSPVVYMNQEALELMFPGLVISLTGTNGGTCPNTTETFMVTEVHPYLGYVTVLNAGQDGSPYLPQWGTSVTCTGTSIGQTGTNLVNPH